MSSVVESGISENARLVNSSRKAKKKSVRHDNRTGYLFISPWLFGFLVFTLFPMLASLVLSFTDYRLTAAPHFVGLDNFQTMFFDDPRYWKSVRATFFYVFSAVPLRLAFALGLAMLLNNTRRGISTYRALFYAPSIVGASVAVAIMWRQIFGIEASSMPVCSFSAFPRRSGLAIPIPPSGRLSCSLYGSSVPPC